MAVVNPKEQGIAIQIKNKLGHAWGYGEKIYGEVRYGATMVGYGLGLYGKKTYGETEYGNAIERPGIYQIRTRYNKQVTVREIFYWPKNPQTQSQQANRQKLTDGVTAWQGLTSGQKEIYNERARYKPYSGFNLYLKEYILSN